MLQIELCVVGSTDRTVRTEVWISGGRTGELQVGREDFTRLADLLFGKNYKLITASNAHKNHDPV